MSGECRIRGCRNLQTTCVDCGRVVCTATLPVFSEWIPFKENDKRLENHSIYLVTDGIIVIEGYFDCDEFVGCKKDMIGKVTHWMPFPKPPKKE